jgi:hypothetical protein
MKPSKIFMPIAAATLFGSAAAVANSGATQILYKTGFEPTEFKVQPLVGQQGWGAPPPLSPNAAVISMDKPRQGKQSVLVPGNDLEHQDFINEATGGYYDAIGSYRRPVCADATQPGCTTDGNLTGYDVAGKVVRVSAHVRVDGRHTHGSNFFSASVGAIALGEESGESGPEGVGELAISSDGHVHAYTGADAVPKFLGRHQHRVTLDEWHTLAVEADFVERKTAFFVDDECIGIFEFDSRVTTNVLLRGSMLVYAAPDSTIRERKLYEKKDYSAHFDQFAIKVEGRRDWHDCHDCHDCHDRHDRHDRDDR